MQNKSIQYIFMAVAVSSLIISLYNFSTKQKMAFVDTGKLMTDIKEMQEAKKQIESSSKQATSRLDTLTSEFESQLKKHEKESAKMTSSEKRLSEELLDKKQMELGRFRQAVQQNIMKSQQAISGDVVQKINKYIQEYGKEKSYKIIFATTQGNIAYADEVIDISKEIVDGYNARYSNK